MDILSQEITIVVVASSFFLLVAVGIVVLFLVYQKRQLKYILEKKELSNQFQRELLKTRLEAHEETMNQLSTELHDNIGQLLSSSKFLIGVAERALELPPESLRMAEETISKAIQEVRALSKSLNTEWLEKFNLLENLQMESDRIKISKVLHVTLQHPQTINMPADRQLMLFRIVQEALQNAIKHGQASTIGIEVIQLENELSVSIKDDGRGFDIGNVSLQGVGINSIKHRTKLLNGVVRWNSTTHGTSVTIQLPNYGN
jgi:signal transduction histidine kinase